MSIATSLRRRQTSHEANLWMKLRDRRFRGYKFRRQHRIGRWICDFVCVKQKLIIELDGAMHALRKNEDEERDAELVKKGYLVLRIKNYELKNSLEWHLEKIRIALERDIRATTLTLPSPSSAEEGEG